MPNVDKYFSFVKNFWKKPKRFPHNHSLTKKTKNSTNHVLGIILKLQIFNIFLFKEN
jgi:hypothetical protein